MDRADDSEWWRRRTRAWRWTVVSVLFAVPVLVVVGQVLAQNDSVCIVAPSLPVCSPGVRLLVVHLPVLGGVGGALVCFVAGGLALRYRRTPSPWIALGLVLPVAATVVAAGLASLEEGSADATTAADTRPAPVPAAPRARTWVWHAPEGLSVFKVVPAGAGVVVAVEDGVVALDGVNGQERWHYRVPGGPLENVAAGPAGDTVVLSYRKPRERTYALHVLVLDATTGTVVLDTNIRWEPYFDGFTAMALTDHVLVGAGSFGVLVRAFDPTTGAHRWDHHLPEDCELWDENPKLVTGAGVVTIGMTCGRPSTSAAGTEPATVTVAGLDERTGRPRWQHTMDGVRVAALVPAEDGSAVFLQRDGAAALLDPATGATVLDTPGTQADRVIGATREWLATAWPDSTTYALTTVDSPLPGPTTVPIPGVRSAAAATEQRVYVLHAAEDRFTLVTQPWTGTGRSTAAAARPGRAENREEDWKDDYELVPAPGAIVITEPQGTTVTGMG